MSIKCGDCGTFIDTWGKCECHDPLYEVPVWERVNDSEGDCENVFKFTTSINAKGIK